MIKLIIFDLDGVLIKSKQYFSDAFADKYKIDNKEVVVILKRILGMAGDKSGGTFSYWKPHLDEWGVNIIEKDFFDMWFDVENTKAVDEVIQVYNNVKNQGYKVAILSDQFVERAKYMKETFDFVRNVDGVYLSGEIGMTKEDPRAFEKILNDFNFKPEEVVFIDDDPENVKVAKVFGINGIRPLA